MNKKQKMISQCCVCKKVKRKEGFKYTHRKHMDEWGHYHEDLKELHGEYELVYSHGLCEPCFETHYKKQLDVMRNKR